MRVALADSPDLVLCDIRMPVLDGLGMLEQVTRDASLQDVRVVMLTTFELDEYVFEALRYGASGFLLKDAEPSSLLDAIRVVADGGSLLAPTVTRRVIEHFGKAAPRRTSTSSPTSLRSSSAPSSGPTTASPTWASSAERSATRSGTCPAPCYWAPPWSSPSTCCRAAVPTARPS